MLGFTRASSASTQGNSLKSVLWGLPVPCLLDAHRTVFPGSAKEAAVSVTCFYHSCTALSLPFLLEGDWRDCSLEPRGKMPSSLTEPLGFSGTAITISRDRTKIS